MVSNKFLHDDGEEDEVFVNEWAKSGGMSCKDLIRLEKEFLNQIQWQVFVNDHSFWKKLGELESTIAKRQGIGRGWFTYTEIQNIPTSIDVWNLIQYLSNVITILTATYALGFLTLLGSVFIASNLPGNYLHDRSDASVQSVQGVNCSLSEAPCNTLVTHFEENIEGFKNKTKQLDAADVLKTGILLASIKSQVFPKKNNITETIETSEFDPWAWWNHPAMIWITETSVLLQEYIQIPQNKYSFCRFRNEPIANFKILNLGDKLHKATKVRIQDQLEQSWHVEWTDTLKNLFLINKLTAVVS